MVNREKKKRFRNLKLTQKQRERKQKMLNRQREYHRIFNSWRDYDFITTILAMIGLALAVANYEINIRGNYPSPDYDNLPDPMQDPRNRKPETNLVRIIIGVTTLLAVACLCMRHYYKV
jgi:hypothetical protein